MPERSELEQKLLDEAAATRRCVTALERVDLAATRRILAWLVAMYGPIPAPAESPKEAS
jgi:hypothetical protein